MHLEQVPGFKNMYSPSSILFCESKKNFLVVFSLVSGNDHYRCSKELFLKYYGAYPQNRSDPFHMFLLLLHTQKWVPATDRCSNGFCKVHLRIRTFNLWASLLSNRLFFLPLPLTFHVRFWSCMVGGNINYIQIEEMEKHVRKSYSRPFFSVICAILLSYSVG